jgi:hypothetical protein
LIWFSPELRRGLQAAGVPMQTSSKFMFRHPADLLPLLLGSCVAPLRVWESDAPLPANFGVRRDRRPPRRRKLHQ